MMDESQSWNMSLLTGTSLEWQRMMQHGDHDAKRQGPQEVLPAGEWLNDKQRWYFMVPLSVLMALRPLSVLTALHPLLENSVPERVDGALPVVGELGPQAC